MSEKHSFPTSPATSPKVPRGDPEGAVVPLADPEEDELIDLNSEESFPASDPPSWTLGHEEHHHDHGPGS